MSMSRYDHAIAASLLLLCAGPALAGSVSIPNTFAAHTPAVATEVNANFGAVASAVNDSATDIAALQAAVANMQSQLTTQQNTINTLNATVAGQQTTINTLNTGVTSLNATVAGQQTTIVSLTSQLAAVQGSAVMALNANLALVDVPDPNNSAILYPTAQFTGINVQIVNGTGDEETTNGLGNLIVGYNPVDSFETIVCSIGIYQDQSSCESNSGIWASSQRSGSHNLIVGKANAYSQYGGFLAGTFNVVNAHYASVSGGDGNIASGFDSSVSGGYVNRARGVYSSVSGGENNTANSASSSVSGGNGRVALYQFNWTAGGLSETH